MGNKQYANIAPPGVATQHSQAPEQQTCLIIDKRMGVVLLYNYC